MIGEKILSELKSKHRGPEAGVCVDLAESGRDFGFILSYMGAVLEF